MEFLNQLLPLLTHTPEKQRHFLKIISAWYSIAGWIGMQESDPVPSCIFYRECLSIFHIAIFKVQNIHIYFIPPSNKLLIFKLSDKIINYIRQTFLY